MRKANRIMMVTVSVLLTLTLISTCLISGLYAKYVTKEDSLVTVSFKKFGVNIEIWEDTTALGNLYKDWPENSRPSVVVDKDGDSASIEFSNLKMGPGDNLSELVHFRITGQADVALVVKIVYDINFNLEDYTVAEGVGGLTGSSAARSCFPFQFKFTPGVGKKSENLTTPFVPNKAPITRESVCYTNIDKYLDFTAKKVDDDDYYDFVYKTFKPGQTIAFYHKDDATTALNEFATGFLYPKTARYNDGGLTYDKCDEIMTYLAQHKSSSTFSVKYTILVEQIQNYSSSI